MAKQSKTTVRGPSANRSLADKFLLAIIDAYPTDLSQKAGSELAAKKERERRLLGAKKALFGDTSGPGQAMVNDERALRWMACLHLSDFGKPPAKRRSDRELAELAASKTSGNSADAIVDRLRKKFAKDKQHYLEVEYYDDGVDAAFEAQDLQNLKEPLQRIGIEMNLEDLFKLILG